MHIIIIRHEAYILILIFEESCQFLFSSMLPICRCNKIWIYAFVYE